MPGDLVLVRNVGLKGKNKIADRWEKDMYLLIIKPKEGFSVYLVKDGHGRGPRKFLFMNLLLPFMALPLSNTKAKESSVSNIDDTQILLDEKNTVTDDTDQTALLDVSDNVSLNEPYNTIQYKIYL